MEEVGRGSKNELEKNQYERIKKRKKIFLASYYKTAYKPTKADQKKA